MAAVAAVTSALLLLLLAAPAGAVRAAGSAAGQKEGLGEGQSEKQSGGQSDGQSEKQSGGAAALGAGLDKVFASLIDTGGVAVSESGKVIYSYGGGSYVPASIIKLATALAAFDYLGPDYRFKTELYRGEGNSLIVRGYGDPYLVSEEWRLIGGELAAAGLFSSPLGDLITDDSAFAAGLEVDGATHSLNPYDAPLGALVSNFNTMFVEVRRDGRISSAEPQTPLTPMALSRARGMPPGKHRINFSRTPADGLRYTGELAREIFRQSGAVIEGAIRRGRISPGAVPVLVHSSSRPLRKGVAGMLEFSNNYIANQILLVMGMEARGPPARFEAGLTLMRRYLTDKLGLKPGGFHVEEGSGLSRKNHFRLVDMLRIVEAFRPWRGLLKPYGKEPWQAPAKTGTLTGIYTLAGYMPNHPERAFVIMLNQHRNTRAAVFRHLLRAFGR